MGNEYKVTDYKGFEIFSTKIVNTWYMMVSMPFPYPNDGPLFPSLEKAEEFIDDLGEKN